MDLVGTMLVEHLRRDHAGEVEVEAVAPAIRPVTSRVSVNRAWLRFVDYPSWLRRNRARFDLFHIVDHSYSQLVHDLPPGRAIVTCHDIETFRCLLEPDKDRRPLPFRLMTRRILAGFKKAAQVACDSHATLDDLVRHSVLPPERLSVVPLAPHPSCSPDPDPPADAEAERLLGPKRPGAFDLLHVGSTVHRKRIDLLLRVSAMVRDVFPGARLVRVGGTLNPIQRRLARGYGIGSAILELPFLDRAVLAAVYRRATVALLTSEMEGFGLPVVEALACGTPVVASDLPVLREVGGDVASYCGLEDPACWLASVTRFLALQRDSPHMFLEWQRKCTEQGAHFSWKAYAKSMLAVYNKSL